jgi:pyruvate dehydrogenase E2 component (dihydrolipoamide acetyltransferase)
MSEKAQKKLRLHKLTRKDIGDYRMMVKTVLDGSPDPYVCVMYSIELGKCKEFVRSIREKTGKKVTLTHVLNKLFAMAIAENPLFNQFILGGSIYEKEDIHIANVHMLPGEDNAVTYLILENPHLKTLVDIQHEFDLLRKQKLEEHSQKRSEFSYLFRGLYFKLRLDRLIPEKLAFKIGFNNGLTSNIMFANHVFKEPGNYIVIKPVVAVQPIPLRIHAHGAIKQTAVEQGQLVTKEIMPINVIFDHRLLWGVHIQQFGSTLSRLAANPERYLSETGK